MRIQPALRALVLTTTVAAGAATTLHAQGPMRVAPSGRATTEVVLTLVDSVARAAAQPARIRIDYGQPHLRGRRLLTDSLVPLDKPWRAGANEATTLTSDVDLTIGGTSVPKGRYVLQALPTKSGWTLIVQKAPAGSAPVPAGPYEAANDVARIAMRPVAGAGALESLTYWLIPSTQSGAARGELRMAWGSVAVMTEWTAR